LGFRVLEVRGLRVVVGGVEVVKGVDLGVGRGEVHVIMGPNAAGKSSLLAAIAGLRKYRVVSGKVLFEGRDVTHLPLDERARLGIALAHQIPPVIKGVRVRDLVTALIRKYGVGNSGSLASLLRVGELMDRYLFLGFSGGERKRLELYLASLQRPKLAMLDEPDSGVDVDSLSSIAEAIAELVRSGSSVLLVTHTGYVLEKLSKLCGIDYAHVMVRGRIVYSGLADEVVPLIMKHGYSGALRRLGVGS